MILPGFGPAMGALTSRLSPKPNEVSKPPSREDPDIIAAREKQRLAEINRKGRRSTILTNSLNPVSVQRARAGSTNLGGT